MSPKAKPGWKSESTLPDDAVVAVCHSAVDDLNGIIRRATGITGYPIYLDYFDWETDMRKVAEKLTKAADRIRDTYGTKVEEKK